MTTDFSHTSVLLRETVEFLQPKAGETALDLTTGLGGHSEAILEMTAPHGVLFAVETDEQNLAFAKKRLGKFSDRVRFLRMNFSHIADAELPACDMILADLGLSSPHIDIPERGFSIRFDGPLDMRFDRSSGQTAAALITSSTDEHLGKIFAEYGEFPGAFGVAKRVRAAAPETTAALKKVVEEALGHKAPAILPQIFQALRMAVNDEIAALQNLLDVTPSLLKPGGRLAIISYHSLEDRLVKRKFRALSSAETDSVTGAPLSKPEFIEMTKKCIVPSAEEVTANPRSRSAKLRVIQKPLHL